RGPWSRADRTGPAASRSGWRPTGRRARPQGRSRIVRPTARRAPALRPDRRRAHRVRHPQGRLLPSTRGRGARSRVHPEILAVAEGDVAGRGLLGGQAVDVDESAGAGLIEGVALVVGGQIEVVQAGLGAAPGDGRAAAVQRHADIAVDVALGVLDEGVQGLLQGGEPLAVVDQLRPAVADGALETGLLALEGDALELLVGGDQRHRAGCLVVLAGLDAHQAVLDSVDAADALGAGAAVHLLDGLQGVDGTTVDRDRDAALEGDDDLVGHRREGRIVGVAEDVLGGLVPDVLEEPGLDGTAPHVLVDRERVVLGGLDRQALAFGVLDGLVAGQGEVANRGDALQLGGERGDRDLEADLVVALAGAAVGDRAGTILLGGLDQVLGDHRTRDGR